MDRIVSDRSRSFDRLFDVIMLLSLAISGYLGVTGIIQNLDSGCRTQLAPVIQDPNYFLFWSYFNQLRSGTSVAHRAENGVAIL